jgi:hypothetical protein
MPLDTPRFTPHTVPSQGTDRAAAPKPAAGTPSQAAAASEHRAPPPATLRPAGAQPRTAQAAPPQQERMRRNAGAEPPLLQGPRFVERLLARLTRAETQMADLAAYGAPCAANLTAALSEARTLCTDGSAPAEILHAMDILDGAELQISRVHQRVHSDEMAARAGWLGIADALAAGGRSALPADFVRQLDAYSSARARATYHREDSLVEQRQAGAELEHASNALIITIWQRPEEFDGLRKLLNSVSVKLVARALDIRPKTMAQWCLQSTVGERSRNWALATESVIRHGLSVIETVDELLRQVAADARSSQVPDDEKAYVRQAIEALSLAPSVQTLARPLGLTPVQRQEYDVAVKAFEQALRAVEQTANAQVTETLQALEQTGSAQVTETPTRSKAPDRFTRALEQVQALAQRSQAVLEQHCAVVKREIDKIDDPLFNEFAKCGLAVELVQGTVPTVLESLPVGTQIDLLTRIRQSTLLRSSRPADFDRAQASLYRAIRLDEGFLSVEKSGRKEVIARLMQRHEAQLRDARNHWPLSDPEEKVRILTLIAQVHAEVMGFKQPEEVKLYKSAPSDVGIWRRDDHRLGVNEAGSGFNDFALMMDNIFHENSHNRQHQLVAAQPKPGIEPKPGMGQARELQGLHTQTRLFALNQQHYYSGRTKPADPQQSAYREQPMERHAFHTGPRFARALLRALDR